MEVTIKGKAKELAALVHMVRGRRGAGQDQTSEAGRRESLIREFECRLAELKDGTGQPDDVDQRESLIRKYEHLLTMAKNGAIFEPDMKGEPGPHGESGSFF